MIDFKKKIRRKILVVDGQNLAHRAFHRFKAYQTNSGTKSGLAFGLVFMLESMVRRFRADEVHIAFDSGKSPYRLGILPNYKNRVKKLDFDFESFDKQLHDLMAVLQVMGCFVYYGGTNEADDTLYRIIRKVKGKAYITLVSGDKDFVQMLVPRFKTDSIITIYNPNKDAVVTPANARELYGYSAEENVDYLILDGDKSDKIPGIYGWGPVKIRKFLDEYGSIAEYLDEYDDPGVEETYERNKQLIDLHEYYINYGKDEPIGLQNNALAFDKGMIKEFSRKYQLTITSKEQFLLSMGGLVDED